MSEVCTALGIPEHLWRNDRPEIAIPDGDSLYRRIPRHHFELGSISGKLSASAFPLKNDSYNLASLCNDPEDVLYSIVEDTPHYSDHGIIKLLVAPIQKFAFEYDSNKNTNTCHINIKHVPEDCMFPHTEIHVMVNDVNQAPPTSKQTKDAIRLLLRETHEIILTPVLEPENKEPSEPVVDIDGSDKE